MNDEAAKELAERMESLERQLQRVGDQLQSQATDRRKWPKLWKFSLLRLLVFTALIAGIAALVAAELRQAAAQSRAVDILLAERNARFRHQPSESILVGLLPGPPSEPPAFLVRMLGFEFFNQLREVSIENCTMDVDEAIRGLKMASRLRALRFRKTVLSSRQMQGVLELKGLESLDVSRTVLGEYAFGGVSELNLRWLDASHTRLGNVAALELSECSELEYLSLERTSVGDEGVNALASLKKLRYLNLRRTASTLKAVSELAKALPNCQIYYQPLVFKSDGSLDSLRIQQGARKFGPNQQNDPRVGKYARPPFSLQIRDRRYLLQYRPNSFF